MTVKPIQDAYSAVAELYIEMFGSDQKVHADDLALIGRHLTGRGTLLDLGCGPGHLTDYLHRRGADDVTGIDAVPAFVSHARAAYPNGRYRLGSLGELDVADGSVDGILAWYSLIHLRPEELDPVLDEFRRVLAPAGALVVGFFDGDDVAPFDHKVITAYRWPAGEMSRRLARAGFTETERLQRPTERADRKHAAIAARLDGGRAHAGQPS